MQHDDFLGLVQSRAKLASAGEATKATRAVLQTLGERLGPDEAHQLGAQLPEEIGRLVQEGGSQQARRFDVDEFFERVSAREGEQLPGATFHARAVMSVVSEAVSAGELEDVRAQLPAGFQALLDKEAHLGDMRSAGN